MSLPKEIGPKQTHVPQLDKARARIGAIKLGQYMNEINWHIRRTYPDGKHTIAPDVTLDNYLGSYTLSSAHEEIPGLGVHQVSLGLSLSPKLAWRLSPQTPQDFPILSYGTLTVDAHVDEPTKAQIDALRVHNPDLYIATKYDFDVSGKYGKRVFLPWEIEDSRPVAPLPAPRGKSGRYVYAEMTDEDFLLASRLVNALGTHLRSAGVFKQIAPEVPLLAQEEPHE